MKLEGLKDQKLTKLNFSEKFLFLGKENKYSPKIGFFGFYQLCSFAFLLSRLQGSLFTSTSGKNQLISQESWNQEKVAPENIYFHWLWQGVSRNQLAISQEGSECINLIFHMLVGVYSWNQSVLVWKWCIHR